MRGLRDSRIGQNDRSTRKNDAKYDANHQKAEQQHTAWLNYRLFLHEPTYVSHYHSATEAARDDQRHRFTVVQP